MAKVTNERVETYFYRSVVASRRHRNMVSAYLVERQRDAKVVARIESLGLMSTRLVEQEIARRALKRHLVLAGRWQPTSSSHHARVRVARVTARATVSR